MTRPHLSRRIFRVSLRGLLVLMALIAGVFAFWVKPSLDQRRAVEQMSALGMEYDYDFEEDGDPKPGPEWLREALGVDFLADIVAVQISFQSKADLTPLRHFPKLEVLYCYDVQIEGFEVVGGLKHLREVHANDSGIQSIEPLR